MACDCITEILCSLLIKNGVEGLSASISLADALTARWNESINWNKNPTRRDRYVNVQKLLNLRFISWNSYE